MRRSIIALWTRAVLHGLRAVMAFKAPRAQPSGPKPSGPKPLDLS